MNNSPPYMYSYKNAVVSTYSPNTVHTKDSALYRYFQKYYLQKALSVFKFTLPETWSKEYFLYCVFGLGYVVVFNTDKFGTIPQSCGLGGYDVFYRPTRAIVSNPLIKTNVELRIGKNCEIFKLQPDYSSILDIVGYYADLSALACTDLSVNLINTKLAYILLAKDKKAAESLKKVYDKIECGDPMAVVDQKLATADGKIGVESIFQNLSQNYIADKILVDMKKIENAFESEIGIHNVNQEKRERLLTEEINANNDSTLSKASLWLETMKESAEKINSMFGLNLDVDWRFDNASNLVNTGDL